ncbi:MAG: branched-chain amino acid aminotransferase [Rhodopirellula sp.]|nr:branched-chain amino acid aminotransferase [Rhodopirellula sp.]
MMKLAEQLLNDEAGFLLSAELILISTVLTLGMVVGLSEVSHAINNELFDVASAFDSVNQGYRYDGLFDGHGSSYGSQLDDYRYDISCRGY